MGVRVFECVQRVCACRGTRGARRNAVEAPACARPRCRGGVRGHRGRGMTATAATAWRKGGRWEGSARVSAGCEYVCVHGVLVFQGRGSTLARRSRRRVKAKARAWLMARVCTHARESWHPGTAAWPCRARGTAVPGPRHDAAVRCDSGGREYGGTTGSCNKSGTKAGIGAEGS
jgi:hypothetical protein